MIDIYILIAPFKIMKVNCPNCKKSYDLSSLDVEIHDTLVCSVCNTEWSLNTNSSTDIDSMLMEQEQQELKNTVKKTSSKKRKSMLDKFLTQKKKSNTIIEKKGKNMKEENENSNLNSKNEELINDIKSSIENINKETENANNNKPKEKSKKDSVKEEKQKNKVRNHFFDKIHEEIKKSSEKAEVEEMPYEDLKSNPQPESNKSASNEMMVEDLSPAEFDNPNMYGTPWEFITSEYMSTNQNKIKKSTYNAIISLKSYINIYIEKTNIALNKYVGDPKEEKIKKLYIALERLNKSCDNLQSVLDIQIKGNVNIIQSLQYFVEVAQKSIDYFEENNTTLNKDLPKKIASISVAISKAELDIKLQHDSVLNGTQIIVNSNMFNSNGYNMPMQFVPPQHNQIPQPYVPENSVEQIDIKKLNDEISKSINEKLDHIINNQSAPANSPSTDEGTKSDIEENLLNQIQQMKEDIKSIKEKPEAVNKNIVPENSVSSVPAIENSQNTFNTNEVNDIKDKDDLNKKFNTLIGEDVISEEFEEVYLDEYGDPIDVPEEHSIENYYQYYENEIQNETKPTSNRNVLLISVILIIFAIIGAFTFSQDLRNSLPKQFSFISNIFSFNMQKPVVFTNISYDIYDTGKNNSVDVTAILQNNSYLSKDIPNIEMHVFDQTGKLIKIVNIPNNKNISIEGLEEYIISRTFHNLSKNSKSIELIIND